MKEPTKEEVKEFWERCGLVKQFTSSWYVNEVGGAYVSSRLPSIDPNNLFKYAVPKIREWIKDDAEFMYLLKCWVVDFVLDEEDPALALFRAIYKAIKEDK